MQAFPHPDTWLVSGVNGLGKNHAQLKSDRNMWAQTNTLDKGVRYVNLLKYQAALCRRKVEIDKELQCNED